MMFVGFIVLVLMAVGGAGDTGGGGYSGYSGGGYTGSSGGGYTGSSGGGFSGGDIYDEDNDGRTYSDYDADGDGRYESYTGDGG